MKILIQNEATNASNIGSYKNTPNINKTMRRMSKSRPEPGSHVNWHKVINENSSEDNNIVDIIITYISQDDKWDVDSILNNDNLSPSNLSRNETTFKQLIRSEVIPIMSKYSDPNGDLQLSDIARIINKPDIANKIKSIIKRTKLDLNESYKKLNEGIIDDLFDLAFSDNSSDKEAETELEQLIKPHTVNDLFEGVVYTLKTKGDEETQNIINNFFNKSVKYKGNDINLFRNYKDKLEQTIVDYVIDDGKDVVNEIQNKYKSLNRDISEIGADVYFGTIISSVLSNHYDCVDKLKSIYKEFINKFKPNNNANSQTTSNKNDGDNNKSINSKMNTILSKIKKQFPNVSDNDLSDAISAVINSDLGIGLIKDYLK